MLIDSFDRKKYAPERSFETKMVETKLDDRKKSFKYILQRNSTDSNLNSSTIEKSVAIKKDFGDIQNPSDKLFTNSANQQVANSKKIHIGTLSDDTPTVSELLYNTKYKNNCWKMLEKDVNSSKPFKSIPAGTDIFLDKSTSEIVWGEKHNDKTVAPSNYKPKLQSYKSASDPYKSDTYFSSSSQYSPSKSGKSVSLHEAVREFMGKEYSKIDCYELVVNGLKKLGVKYGGRGGLGNHLIDKAVGEGRKQNHYLTGEGLVQATGQSVYNKRVLNVNNPISQAKSAMNEMENVLKEGQILSFSTRTRGHTGVISKRNGVWTFINSGYMDNNIAGKNGKKQVGEEILSKELENWFKLAGKKRDGLMITLGNIDLMKLASYQTNKRTISEKV